jgi:hypothetical protein
VPYPAIEAAVSLRDAELLSMAWEQLMEAPRDPWRWGVGLMIWRAAQRRWPWNLPLPPPEQLPERHRVQLLQTLQAGWLSRDGLDELLEVVPDVQRALHLLPGTLDTVLDQLPSLASEDREHLRQAYQAAQPSLRFQAFDWASVDAADQQVLNELEQLIIKCLTCGEGFSLVRLGDGEGLFLAGQRPCLGGATTNGSQRDPRIESNGHLPSDLHAAMIERCLLAIENADRVGVPDLSQCLQGPEHYGLVLATLWKSLSPQRQTQLAPRLLPGGCHLHLYWLASGAYERPPFLNVHGVIAPQLPPNLAGRVNWQPIPGEKGHHGDAEGPAHYPVVYNETLSWIDRQARPGRLFLVGAGILGKIYSDAIRQRGGVAIDVGSVMDLCGGLRTSRGEFRLNPFLLPLATRAFPQPDPTA